MSTVSKLDGYVELSFQAENTQVLANIHPPRHGGQPVALGAVTARLRSMGVTYGVRDQEITRAIEQTIETGLVAARVLVAQGIVAEDGTDAAISWRLSEEMILRPLPRLSPAAINFFRLEPERRVHAGQQIAVIRPADPGHPGKTMATPARIVPQRPGKELAYTCGPGVSMQADRRAMIADRDGYVAMEHGVVTVHPLEVVSQPLPSGEHRYAAGVVLASGAVPGARVYANGSIIVAQTVTGVLLRARGDITLAGASHCRIIADRSIFVVGSLEHCEVAAQGSICSLGEGVFVGGNLVALEQITAPTLGGLSGERTQVTVGHDRVAPIRLEEDAHEIAACEAKAQRIAESLKPFAAAAKLGLDDARRLAMQQLTDHKRNLENRVRELQSDRRRLTTSISQPRDSGTVRASRALPGVAVTIGKVETSVESEIERVSYTVEPGANLVYVSRW